ncbi:MAG: LPS-assembly protein LptD, partial [Deltaproteobacteria bacterium]
MSGYLLLLLGFFPAYAQEQKSPIVVNGDTVEYSANNKEVIASGHVVVIYKNARLTCRKITVNTDTKDAQAEGDVRLEDERGIIEGSKITYNFQTKTGVIIDANFRSNPFFGKAEKVEKISEEEFIAMKAYVTTCNFDHPHYLLRANKVDFFPQDKMQIKGAGFYLKDTRLLYLPQYDQSFRDTSTHWQVMPGYKKDWGASLLTAYRYSLTDNVQGRLYLDYRNRLGLAEGFDTRFTTPYFGKGNFKFYYTDENDKRSPEGEQSEFQRYFLRFRHRWDIDPRTVLISEYYRIEDKKRIILGPEHNILKDYFPREFDVDSQPPTYAVFHHAFDRAAFDVLFQKRINRWYDADKQLEKLPQVQYVLPSTRIWETPLFYENNSSFVNFSQKHPAPASGDFNETRLDTTNKFSLPVKLLFLRLTPFVASRQTYYNKDANDNTLEPRNIFYAGADASARFYRLYNVKSNFLGMDINGLRHVINPSIGYSYNREPSVSSSQLRQLNPIDAVDSIDLSNAATLELSNKLQTKRNGQTVDLLDLRLTTDYVFYNRDPQTEDKNHGHLSDFLIRLKLIPYSWMRLDADAIYDTPRKHFTEVNPSVSFHFGKERSISFSHRYLRKGGKEMTFSGNWRLNPKWTFGIYERYQFADIAGVTKGLAEQQYTFSRDLHCWIMDFTYDIDRDG